MADYDAKIRISADTKAVESQLNQLERRIKNLQAPDVKGIRNIGEAFVPQQVLGKLEKGLSAIANRANTAEKVFARLVEEIDVTTIGQTAGATAPFKTYITGFADGSGSATIYTTDDDTSLASRIVSDVLQAQQVGATAKLYIDRVFVSGTVNDAQSRFISVPIILTSASLSVDPDNGQSVSVNFRPSAAPTFDLSTSA